MTDRTDTTRSQFLADLDQLRPTLQKKLGDMTEAEWVELSRGIADMLDRAKKEFVDDGRHLRAELDAAKADIAMFIQKETDRSND